MMGDIRREKCIRPSPAGIGGYGLIYKRANATWNLEIWQLILGKKTAATGGTPLPEFLPIHSCHLMHMIVLGELGRKKIELESQYKTG